MVIVLCRFHGLPTKKRKDGNGRFCIKCIDPKARGNGSSKVV